VGQYSTALQSEDKSKTGTLEARQADAHREVTVIDAAYGTRTKKWQSGYLSKLRDHLRPVRNEDEPTNTIKLDQGR